MGLLAGFAGIAVAAVLVAVTGPALDPALHLGNAPAVAAAMLALDAGALALAVRLRKRLAAAVLAPVPLAPPLFFAVPFWFPGGSFTAAGVMGGHLAPLVPLLLACAYAAALASALLVQASRSRVDRSVPRALLAAGAFTGALAAPIHGGSPFLDALVGIASVLGIAALGIGALFREDRDAPPWGLLVGAVALGLSLAFVGSSGYWPHRHADRVLLAGALLALPSAALLLRASRRSRLEVTE